MAKKNPYVTTIGFNRDDPDHVYVAGILNSMGRGKAQYIVKAIMAYQNPDRVSVGHVAVVPTVDYDKIRTFVLQVLEERASFRVTSNVYERLETKQVNAESKIQDMCNKCEEDTDLDENMVNDIMASLRVFR